jgi:hypothetical protein
MLRCCNAIAAKRDRGSQRGPKIRHTCKKSSSTTSIAQNSIFRSASLRTARASHALREVLLCLALSCICARQGRVRTAARPCGRRSKSQTLACFQTLCEISQLRSVCKWLRRRLGYAYSPHERSNAFCILRVTKGRPGRHLSGSAFHVSYNTRHTFSSSSAVHGGACRKAFRQV